MPYNKKIKIISVTPRSARNLIERKRKCFIAASLNNSFFNTEKLDLLLNWTSKRFDQCIIIISDYLYRYNVEILTGKTGKDAEIEANAIGQGFKNILDKYLSAYSEEKFKVIHWKEYTQKPDFVFSLTTVEALYDSNQQFRNSVDKTAKDFISRLSLREVKPVISDNKAIELSIKFILEECAVYNLLSLDGYNVDIYPGTYLPVLQDISEGKFPDAPEGLKRKINIEIKTIRK